VTLLSENPWIARRGHSDYAMTKDRTAIARFATADEARPHGRPVLTGCPTCRKHADEFVPCDCGKFGPAHTEDKGEGRV
jgi:hypothetical protein